MPTSPSVLNYAIPKGIVYFTPDGGAEQDLGNCPSLELSLEVDKIEHVTSRAGIGSVDKTIVRQKTAAGTMVLDEITPYNLRLAMLGDAVASNSEGNSEFGIFANSSIDGRLRLEGTNDVGNRINMVLPSISIDPGDAIPFIGDEIAQLSLSFTVNYVEAFDDFGTVEFIDFEELTI